MADITMCTGGDCPLRETCYTFMAPQNPYRQSFDDFTRNLECRDGVCTCPDFVPFDAYTLKGPSNETNRHNAE